MSYFRRARKHNKPSVTLDEKIAKAYKEFERTGVSAVLLEGPANRTSGIYYAGKEIPEVPAVFTDVPDPNGVRASGWTQPDGGFDANDPATWENAYSDTSWLYNSNEVFGETNRPVLVSTTNGQNKVRRFDPGAGLIRAYVGYGPSLGYIGDGNVYQGITYASFWGNMYAAVENNFGGVWSEKPYTGYYENEKALMIDAYAKMVDMDNRGVPMIPIKVWYPWSYFWYGTWENVGYVKRDHPTYGKQVLINASIYADAAKYESEPTIPAYTQVIFKDELGRAQNLNMSGFQKALSGLFQLGNSALQSLTNKLIYGKGGPTGGFAADPKYTKEKVQQIANNISDPEKKADFEKKMADLTSTIEKTAQVQKQAETEAKNIAAKFGLDVALTIFGGAILKGAGAAASKIPGASSIVSKATATGGAIVDKVTNLLKLTGKVDDAAALATATKAVNTATKAEQASKAVNALEAIGGTLDDVDDIIAVAGSAKYQAAMTQAKLAGSTTSSSVSNAAFNTLETAIQSGSDDAIRAAVKDVNSKVFGAAASSSTSSGSIVSKINLKPQFKGGGQSFDLGGDWTDIGISQFKSILTNPQKFNITKGSKQWNRIFKYAQDYLVQSYESQGQVLSEGYLQDRIDKRNKKRLVEKKVGGKISKITIPGPKDHLTVRAIDMLRQYKVSEKEMQEYATIIGEINQWIRDNPKEYEIWKVRYPANDPRVAELNWKLDQQLKASEEYVETRFPENQKLYRKLKKKIKSNIDATNPKRFEKEKSEVVYTKLLNVSKAIKLDNIAPL